MYGANMVQHYGQQDVWTTRCMVQQWYSNTDNKMYGAVVGQQCYMVLQ